MLTDKFGTAVEMIYVDIHDDDIKDYPQVLEHIKQPSTPLPIVAVDGQPKWAGAISYQHIVQELESLGVA